MAPLKGNTLGEKHRSYNTLLKETIAKGPVNLPKINYDDDDIDNMMRIDIASKERNVDYIMDVLKSDDMLYVSRAINRSVWLITEPEYAHIINPNYLHSDVFPVMMPKAITKLMLHIKRHLRDEKRVEAFFTYVDNNNPNKAFNWLEYCSLPFTEEIVASRAKHLSCVHLKRLCRKSITILTTYITINVGYDRVPLNSVTFLLKSHTEELLRILLACDKSKISLPTFNRKATQLLMKRCSQKIVDNFKTFYSCIHLSTFVNYLQRNCIDIEHFLLTKCGGCWLDFNKLEPFLEKMSQDKILDFLKKKYGIETCDNVVNKGTEVEELFYAIESSNRSFENVYRWYEFAPYEIAFKDLKKFIYAESLAEERHSMLIVLLKSARKNMEQVRKVLQYYLDKHINEPYINKIRFVNSVLTLHDAFRFDDATWNILNIIFYSLEVYIQSTNNVQQCITAIILRSILHGQSIPEIVEQKFTFDTLIDMKSKLNYIERDAVFDYLFSQLVDKLRMQDMNKETEAKEAVSLLENIWTLLLHWQKEATHHQIVIDNIIKISNLNKQLKRDIDMRNLYCWVKPYHRQLFENSLIIYPCEEMCIHALKHDPGLLVRYESEVSALSCDDSVSLKTFLSKLRIYWRESLSSEWRTNFLNNRNNLIKHQSLVKGTFVLSAQMDLLDFVKMYAPNENKIKWSEADEVEISLRKHIAKNLHMARPQLPPEVIMLYAKGDYLQHSLFSINAVYQNLRSKNIQIHIRALVNTNVSLQKNGIRLSCARIKQEELLDLFLFIWKSTKNVSIRNMLFHSVSEFLCKSDNSTVDDIWKVLGFMIDDLNHKENKRIYRTLGEVSNVPRSVINEYFRKCFVFLRDLPSRFHLSYLSNRVLEYAVDFMPYLDAEFVENTLLISVYDIFSEDNFIQRRVLAAYLLCSKNENTQLQKFKNLFEPFLSKCLPKWNNLQFDQKVLSSFDRLIDDFGKYLQRFVFELNMVIPVKMVTIIRNILKTNLCDKEHYILKTKWKLFAAYIKLLNSIMVEKPDRCHDWSSIRDESINKYAKICLKYLKQDIERFFPSIYILFADAMHHTCEDIEINCVNLQKLLDRMLICKDVHVYLLVLRILPQIYSWPEKKIDSIIKRKLYRFPSKEFRMHFFKTYGQEYNDNNDDFNQDDLTGDVEEKDNSKEVPGNDSVSDSEHEDSSNDESEESEESVASTRNVIKWWCSIH